MMKAAKTIQNGEGYLGKQMIVRVFHNAELVVDHKRS